MPRHPVHSLLYLIHLLNGRVARASARGTVKFHELALIQHRDCVKVGDGVKAVRGRDDGVVAELGADELLHQGIGLDVNAVDILNQHKLFFSGLHYVCAVGQKLTLQSPRREREWTPCAQWRERGTAVGIARG